MRRRFFLGALAAASLVVFLLAQFPARVALAWFTPENLRVTGVAGTVWNGRFVALELGAIRLRESRWSLRPWALLGGRLAGDIDASWAGGGGRGEFSVGNLRNFSLRDFEAAGPIKPVGGLIGMPGSRGNYRLAIGSLSVDDAWPESAVGQLTVTGVPLTPPGARRNSGPAADFEARFDTEPVPAGGEFTGQLRDLGGPLEVSGTIILTPPGDYTLEGQVRPRAGAPQDLVQGLALLGPRNPDGSHTVSLAGSLPGL